MVRTGLPRRILTSVLLLMAALSLQASGQLIASPGTINFGDVQAGTLANYFPSLTNTGTVSVIVTEALLSGKNAQDFSVPNFTTVATIAPGSTGWLQVNFQPSGYGNRTAELQFWVIDPSGATPSYITVNLEGYGRANFANFGLRVHLTPGEAVELNIKSESTCTVQAGFTDGQGNTLVSKTLNLDGIGVQTVRYDTLTATAGLAVQVRPFVSSSSSPAGARSNCSLFASAAVLDTLTNSTLLFIPGQKPPNPNDAYSVLLPASISLFQNLRLNVIGDSGLCTGTLGFSDVTGNPLGSSKTVNLNPGQSDYIEATGRSLVARIGGHSVLQAQFSPSPAAAVAVGVCTVYEEVTDAFSGRTMAVFTPTGVTEP